MEEQKIIEQEKDHKRKRKDTERSLLSPKSQSRDRERSETPNDFQITLKQAKRDSLAPQYINPQEID